MQEVKTGAEIRLRKRPGLKKLALAVGTCVGLAIALLTTSEAKSTNIVGFDPKDVGLIDGNMNCLANWDSAGKKYVPTNGSDEWGPRFARRDQPVRYITDGKYPLTVHGLWGVSIPDAVDAINMDVDLKGSSAHVEFSKLFDQNETPDKVIDYTVDGNDTITDSYDVFNYTITHKTANFVITLWCNQDATIGQMNREEAALSQQFG